MKYLLFIVTMALSHMVSGQSNIYVGDYVRGTKQADGSGMTWKLSLHLDGTFLYHFYRNIDPSQPIEHFYGKGIWKEEKTNVIYFYTDGEKDLDTIHTINFTDTKARINRKSPRDRSDRIIKESIRFYASEAQAIKGLELFKKG